MSEDKGRPVIVCTERRGVFFGYTEDTAGERVTLHSARMAIYFGTTGGVAQLAATGPTPKSRIGSRAPSVELRGVTAVFGASPEAAEAWERHPTHGERQ